MRRLIWILLLGLVAAGFAWAFRPRPVPIELAAVARRTIEATVEEEGRTRIREVFTVSAPTAGRIARLGLHAGDPVVGGETVVASISPAAPALRDAGSRRVAEAAREAAVAALGLAEAELGRAEAQATFAEAELERAGRLFARGTVPERMLEAARLEAAAAQAAVASAQAALGVRRQELASAEAALTEDGSADAGACCVAVAAPASGVILPGARRSSPPARRSWRSATRRTSRSSSTCCRPTRCGWPRGRRRP